MSIQLGANQQPALLQHHFRFAILPEGLHTEQRRGIPSGCQMRTILSCLHKQEGRLAWPHLGGLTVDRNVNRVLNVGSSIWCAPVYPKTVSQSMAHHKIGPMTMILHYILTSGMRPIQSGG